MLSIVKKMVGDNREHRRMMARVRALPEDYRFVYKKMQNYMWKYAAGNGYDMLKVQYELIDLFEAGAADGKHILEITGTDIAAFCDELLRGAQTYIEHWREALNREVLNKLEQKDVPK